MRRQRNPTRLLLLGSSQYSKCRRCRAARYPRPRATVPDSPGKSHSSPVRGLMNPREHAAATLACGLVGEVVRTFGEVRLRVFGTSMAPAILPGDLISVQHAVLSEISNGEIVLYARDGRMFAHRVMGCTDSPEGSLLIARGDRLRHDDPPISSSELLGKVISIERGKLQWRPAPCLSGWERILVHVLRNSDHATYLYLRLAALLRLRTWRAMPLRIGGVNECQRSAGSAECQV
jgi:hypothetical protein